ncbi:native structure Prl-1, partial [Ramicandelaber brevisporus]
SLIEHPTNPHVRFLIMDCPTDTTIPLYLKELARLNVTDVVRVCQPTYDRTRLLHAGIEVHDWPFKDGDVPSTAILKQWLTVQQHQQSAGSSGGSGGVIPMTIAVHCVAGLGRAPVLVAVALIDSGLDPIDAIEKVRRRRRGAFNSKQINFLADGYKKLKLSIPAV